MDTRLVFVAGIEHLFAIKKIKNKKLTWRDVAEAAGEHYGNFCTFKKSGKRN
jgi:hypothetical protein